MIFENSQDNIDFNINPKLIKRIMMRVSGGIDSATVFYMLCKSVEQYPDIEIIPQTTNDWKKPYQVNFAKKIIEWMKNEFPTIKILDHETLQLEHGANYIKGQEAHRESLIKNYYDIGQRIDLSISGVNKIPPADVTDTFVNEQGIKQDGPDDDRLTVRPQWKMNYSKSLPSNETIAVFTPLVNIDKKGVAELCEHLGLTDTLYPITRSCENKNPEKTNNFTTHCGSCWWCHERKWGFGRLV
jgi:7-cyano-7-deazaguanine synthase in queuosine biosynthesis